MDSSADIDDSGGMDGDLPTAKSLSTLSSFDSNGSTIVEGFFNSIPKTGNEVAFIRYQCERIEKLLLRKRPVQAIQMLIEVSDNLSHLSQCDTYSLWERLYLYFAKAYEQVEDWKNVAHCLSLLIKSVERRLSYVNSESIVKWPKATKELLAELCKQYAITLECLNEDANGAAVAWLKVEKAFEDCNSIRDACFSALRAVRWYLTGANVDSALGALSIALDMVKLVGKISERGILYNELGMAFLAFELKDDSIACFRKAIKSLPKGETDARASILQNLGSAYIVAKKLPKAISALEQSVAAYGKQDKSPMSEVYFYYHCKSLQLFSMAGALKNTAGQAQAHCNLGYALMRAGRYKLSHWHYKLARDLAKETAWEAVQIQAEAALNVLETPNFSQNAIKPPPVISICPSMTRLQRQMNSETSSSSSPSVKVKKMGMKGGKRVTDDREKQITEQLTTILPTSSSSMKSSNLNDDIYLPTRQTFSLRKMNGIKCNVDCSPPIMGPQAGDTKISLKSPSLHRKRSRS
ncbi:unnamed protein product [Hydatigera taeniaeformis]|uniref:TPR_REGION domain-containing protein n=1 Tax=Hydatigena taeniaeformis TaxID=6205 RepID=A0A0R3WKC9_HYDTA|nr:unnamed protein product [Hydatigera taeniaeformis]